MLNRRSFLGASAAALALAARGGSAWAATKDDFQGVRIGTNTYSYRGDKIESAEDTLKALLKAGLRTVEIQAIPIRHFTGLPNDPNAKLTDGQREKILAKCVEMRKLYNDAGVTIHVHKIPFGKSDEAIEMNFEVAKALGCGGITLERNEELAKRLAPFAEKHDVMVGFHNHTQNLPVMDRFDPILEISPKIGLSFDIGHYFTGSGGKSPIPVLEKYHDRIVNLHLKDRTVDGGNLPWGEGETPIKEVLQLMKREKWTFPADIELEYKVPKDSTSVDEVVRCAQYCRDALA